jgi:hypothetical protein
MGKRKILKPVYDEKRAFETFVGFHTDAAGNSLLSLLSIGLSQSKAKTLRGLIASAGASASPQTAVAVRLLSLWDSFSKKMSLNEFIKYFAEDLESYGVGERHIKEVIKEFDGRLKQANDS